MEKKNINQEQEAEQKEVEQKEAEQQDPVEEAPSAVNTDETIRSDDTDPTQEQQDSDTPAQPAEDKVEKKDDTGLDITEQFGESGDIGTLASFEQDQQRSTQDADEHLTIPEILPVLPLKDTVVYPFSVQPLGVGQERSIRLIDDVMRGDRLVVLVAQKSAAMEQAGPDDIFKIGTVARVGRMFRMPDGTLQIAVQGLERVVIGEFTQEKP